MSQRVMMIEVTKKKISKYRDSYPVFLHSELPTLCADAHIIVDKSTVDKKGIEKEEARIIKELVNRLVKTYYRELRVSGKMGRTKT